MTRKVDTEPTMDYLVTFSLSKISGKQEVGNCQGYIKGAPFCIDTPYIWALPKYWLDPPTRTQPGTLGHFFRAIFYHSAGLNASENGKCPKPSGQAFRPTQPNGQCPNVGGVNPKESSLSGKEN